MTTMDEAKARLSAHADYYLELATQTPNPEPLIQLINAEHRYFRLNGPDAYLELANKIDDRIARQELSDHLADAWRADGLT